jgi:hypothetical protein
MSACFLLRFGLNSLRINFPDPKTAFRFDLFDVVPSMVRMTREDTHDKPVMQVDVPRFGRGCFQIHWRRRRSLEAVPQQHGPIACGD